MGLLSNPANDPFPELSIARGPSDLLVDFFETAVSAVHMRNIKLLQGTFEQLKAVNHLNQDSWFPLFPTFDFEIGGANAHNAMCLFGYDRSGDVVATQAVRIFDCSHGTLAQEAESLRMFYADPSRQRLPGEICITTTADIAICGCIALCGAVWYRPDYRGLGLSAIMPRLARAYAFVRWQSTLTTALMDERVVRGGITDRNGFTKMASALKWHNSPRGDRSFIFAWMDTAEMLDDLADFLLRTRWDGNVWVKKRRA